MSYKIGVPRSLAYYTFFPLWNTFFEELGFEVLVSKESNKAVLDEGVIDTVNDACVPIKLYHGHVKELADKVDYLFIPRLVSLDGKETTCPKFLGLPDMVKHSIDNLPPMIDVRLDLRNGYFELWRFFKKIGESLQKPTRQILAAYIKSLNVHNKYKKLLENNMNPDEALEVIKGKKQEDLIKPKENTGERAINIALIGYPYTIYDPYISVDLLNKIRKMGANVFTVENIPYKQLLKQKKKFSKEMFWYYSNNTARACMHFLEKKIVDGVIHVTAFGCGPDAMVDKFMELECKKEGNVPFMTIALDEHTGDGGISTRVEAFIDMLNWKRGLKK